MATANKVTVIPCGAMTADLTWPLLKPAITDAEQIHQLRVAPERSYT